MSMCGFLATFHVQLSAFWGNKRYGRREFNATWLWGMRNSHLTWFNCCCLEQGAASVVKWVHAKKKWVACVIAISVSIYIYIYSYLYYTSFVLKSPQIRWFPASTGALGVLGVLRSSLRSSWTWRSTVFWGGTPLGIDRLDRLDLAWRPANDSWKAAICIARCSWKAALCMEKKSAGLVTKPVQSVDFSWENQTTTQLPIWVCLKIVYP